MGNQERRNSSNTMLILLEKDSSMDLLLMPPLDQSAAWSGRVITLFSLEEKCSVPPSHSIPTQEPLEVTTALMSAETSATDLTPLNLPTKKLLSGSPLRKSSSGKT